MEALRTGGGSATQTTRGTGMRMSLSRRTIYRLGLISVAAVLAILAAAGAPATTAVAQQASTDYPLPTDRDGDDVPDSADACPAVAGNLKNGCPGELNADVSGRWRVNALLTQLVSLTVTAPTGSRISIRCSSKRRNVCGFRTHTIRRTTKRLTSLTGYFKRPRILPSDVTIVVRVTRPQQLGVYQKLRTRTGRKLPQKRQLCIAPEGKAKACT